MERREFIPQAEVSKSGNGEPPTGKTTVGTEDSGPDKVTRTLELIRQFNPQELRELKEKVISEFL